MGNLSVNIFKRADGRQDLVEMKIIGEHNTVYIK